TAPAVLTLIMGASVTQIAHHLRYPTGNAFYDFEEILGCMRSSLLFLARLRPWGLSPMGQRIRARSSSGRQFGAPVHRVSWRSRLTMDRILRSPQSCSTCWTGTTPRRHFF